MNISQVSDGNVEEAEDMILEEYDLDDRALEERIRARDYHVCHFFTLLALCHTVMPENKKGQILKCGILQSLISDLIHTTRLCIRWSINQLKNFYGATLIMTDGAQAWSKPLE